MRETTDIHLATTDDDIAACAAVMLELRPHLAGIDFVARVRAQMDDGYELAFVRDGGAVVAVAGARLGHNLAWGRHLYVDDLVTAESARGRGHGGRLFDWLRARAAAAGCESLHLDSGVQRFPAHRLYLQKHMRISSHHFSLDLR